MVYGYGYGYGAGDPEPQAYYVFYRWTTPPAPKNNLIHFSLYFQVCMVLSSQREVKNAWLED
jgi:hypothetical protein